MVAGAYIRLKNGNIELHAPGKIDFKAGSYPHGGPESLGYNMDDLPSSGLYSMAFVLKDSEGNIQKNMPYSITDVNGKKIVGVSDKDGLTKRIYTDDPNNLNIQMNLKDSINLDE